MSKRKDGTTFGDASLEQSGGLTDPLMAQSEDTSLAGPTDVGGASPAQSASAPASLPAAPPVPPVTEKDLEAAKQQLEGDEIPRAAPKAGEGVNLATREVAHPELEPPVPPTEYRVAPAAPDQVERESWSDRPKLEEIEKADRILVQTVDELSGGLVVGGVVVSPQPQEVIVQTLLNRTRQHLIAIATDPRIQVKVI